MNAAAAQSGTQGKRIFLRRCGQLAAATAALWLLSAGPAFLIAGAAGLEGLSIAALLCLLPGCLVFWLASRYGVADGPVFVVLAGTAIRLVVVLTGALAAGGLRPHLGLSEFLIWVVVMYLGTLATETWLVLKPGASAGPQQRETGG